MESQRSLSEVEGSAGSVLALTALSQHRPWGVAAPRLINAFLYQEELGIRR